MRVCLRDLNRETTLGRADIDEGLVILPGELFSNGLCLQTANAGHGLEKALEARRVGVERIKQVLTSLDLVLWLAGPQSLGERTPKAVEARIEHFEQTAKVGFLVAIEVEISFRGVGVSTVRIPLQHAEGD